MQEHAHTNAQAFIRPGTNNEHLVCAGLFSPRQPFFFSFFFKRTPVHFSLMKMFHEVKRKSKLVFLKRLRAKRAEIIFD